MQRAIQLDFIKEAERSSERYWISRVPSVGEFLCIGKDCHEVHAVHHILNANNDAICAIIQVK